MNTFAQRYAAALGIIAIVLLAWWLIARDSRVIELNALLASDPEVAAYIYRFRVVEHDAGVAVMSSPRAANVPVLQFVRAAYPELRNRPLDDPAILAVQEQLVSVQARAAAIVRAEPDVESIRWQLDERWYAERGVRIER
ncbi:MAG: hypothetical protein JJT93_13075 [Gammaproteobacteria bacterium]|nr:hypothetical protein [Gammaproteobacteria bacterium]TVQ43423.1 MAG: hypothetical protein EA371_15160 [Gammaproteobacteria bacterium]